MTNNSDTLNNHIFMSFKEEPEYVATNYDYFVLHDLKYMAKQNVPHLLEVAKNIYKICQIIKHDSNLNNLTCTNTIVNIFTKDCIKHFDTYSLTKNFDIRNIQYGDMILFENTINQSRYYITNSIDQIRSITFNHTVVDDLLVKTLNDLLICKKNSIRICKLINNWFLNNTYRNQYRSKLNDAILELDLIETVELYTRNNVECMMPRKCIKRKIGDI